MKSDNSIEVNNVKKSFKVYLDKGSTMKERVLFKNRRRYEQRDVLKGVSFEIKKGAFLRAPSHHHWLFRT